MLIKSLVVAAVLAMSTLAVSAQAAPTWTVTLRGTIDSGTDFVGVFGTAGQDLTGLSFTQSVTASVDPAQWGYNANPSYYNTVYGYGPSFSDTVTVNGNSVTLNAGTSNGQQFISNDVSNGRPNNYYDYIYSVQQGATKEGGYLFVQNYVYSQATAFVPTLNFDQAIARDLSTMSFLGGSYFEFSTDTARNAYFSSSSLTYLTVNGGAVPEPATGIMLLTGLGLMGWMIIRRRAA